MKRLLCVCVLLAAVVPAEAAVVLHVPTHIAGWRGAWNPTWHPYLQNWPLDSANVSFAEFDKAALQTAIANTIAAYGAWDAKVIVTQVEWINDPIPADFGPVVGSVDIDPATLVWFSAYAYNAGNGSWRYNGTDYGSFTAAVLAGTASGRSAVADNRPWEAIWKPTGVDPVPTADYWDIVVDIPESLITGYLDNPSSDGLFLGSKKTDAYVMVFGYDQWGGAADIRVQIDRPPQTAPWMVLNPGKIELTMALTNPVAPPQNVVVNNAAVGSLAWTAAESPDQTWMSLQNASGGNGDSFQVLVDVTGLAVGNYTGSVVVSDAGANNNPQVLPVKVAVFATQMPVIQLVPTSATFQVRRTDPPPAARSVTVNNIGFATLNWTAAEQGSVSWLWLTNAAGSDGDAFDVHVDHTGLTPGTYSANVQVSDEGASNSPQTLPVTLEIRDQDADITKANSYDDAWESGPDGWVMHFVNRQNNWSGTSGFAVHLGDSITYSNGYGQWARYGSGKTPEDVTICNWMYSGIWGDGTNYWSNGWYLAAYDVPNRGGSFTARSGIRTDQYLAGTYGLPSMDQMFTVGFTNPDGKQYRDAQIAIIMLGTNDASANRSTASMIADLEGIVNKILANNAIVVLSTLPPKRGDQTDVTNYNAAIRNLAQTRKLPLIDFYEEILRRRPGTTWDGTLISSDGVHPSSSGAGYNSSSDPYVSNGAALSEVGYLLRGWLSVQKIKEIKSKVIDTPPAALLPGQCEPPADGTLPKQHYNVIRLVFDGAIVLPAGAALQIVPIGGGADVGDQFTYSLETTNVAQDTLKAVEILTVLTNRTWYRLTPAAGFVVQAFVHDVCTLQGDADGSGQVLAQDYFPVKNHLFEVTEARYDLDGDGMVLAQDYFVAKNHLFDAKPAKP